MNLSRDNLFAKYYDWVYNEYPNDLCSFFWGTVLIVVLFPIVAIGRVVTPGYKDIWNILGNGVLIWVAYGFLSLIGTGTIARFGYKPYGFWRIFILGPIIGAMSVTLILAICAGSTFGIAAVVSGVSVIGTTKNKMQNWWGAIRGKYCTKITWK